MHQVAMVTPAPKVVMGVQCVLWPAALNQFPSLWAVGLGAG